MKALLAIFFAMLPVGICLAQTSSNDSNLACNGSFSDYSSLDVRDIPISGIYIQVSEASVIVQGASGFDGTYSITKRLDNGIGIKLPSNNAYSGFLNRFSGELSLLEQRGEVKADGSYQLGRTIIAACEKAKPLF